MSDDSPAIEAFEQQLRNLPGLRKFHKAGPLYHMVLPFGPGVTILLADAAGDDMYTIGRMDVTELIDSYGWANIRYIVSMSQYNQYTSRAQEAAEMFGIQLLTADDLFRRLHNPGRL